MRKRSSLALAAYLAGAIASGPIFAAGEDGDWPQYRGPARDGVAPASGLARSWPAEGPPVAWRRALGPGFSSLVVAGDRVFTMAAEGEQESVVCLRVTDGTDCWRTELGPLFREEFGDGPRSTPATDGEAVYAVTSTGVLAALRAADGSVLWRADLAERFGTPTPQRGFSPSPLLDGDLVLLEVGGTEGRSIAALDRGTGETRWAVRDGRPGYSSPIAATLGGVRQYVFVPSAGDEVLSILPDGTIHWRQKVVPGVIAMPVLVPPNRIFASASEDAGGALVEVSYDEGKPLPREVWRSRHMKNHFASSIYHQGSLYGFDNATLKCLDAATGEPRWAKRGFGKGNLLAADGLLVILGDQGNLALAEATPEGYRELGAFQAMQGKAWTSPALARGRLYLRDQDEAVALDLRAGASGAASR